MKDFWEIYRYTFSYKGRAILVIICNLLFVIFNLLSLVLFIPVLQLIFKPATTIQKISAPIWNGGFFDFFTYVKDWYNFFMQNMVNDNPPGMVGQNETWHAPSGIFSLVSLGILLHTIQNSKLCSLLSKMLMTARAPLRSV